MTRSAWSWGAIAKLGADRQLHLKGRAFAERRFHPDAPTMHLHDLFGDGEAQARAALRLGVRAVHLVELFEDASLMLPRDAGACISYAHIEMAILRSCSDAYLTSVSELDGVAHEIEQHLREALFVSKAN